jgi:hypothetical protein
MDENLTRQASPDAGEIRMTGCRPQGSNPLEIRDRIPGFHTDFTKKAVYGFALSVARSNHQRTNANALIH